MTNSQKDQKDPKDPQKDPKDPLGQLGGPQGQLGSLQVSQEDPVDLTGLKTLTVIPTGDTTRKHTVASHLAFIAGNEIQAKDLENPVTAQEYLAQMLWSFIITGRAKYSDGVEVRIPNAQEWMKVVRWVTERMDGPPPKEVVIKKTVQHTKIDLSEYSLEELQQLQDLSRRLQGLE